MLLDSLPVKHPEQLILFTGPRKHYGNNSGGNMLSFPMYEDFRDNFVDRGPAPALPRVSQAISERRRHHVTSSRGMFARRRGRA